MGWGGRWEGGSRRKEHTYTYGWFMLIHGRNHHIIVKQSSYNYRKKNLEVMKWRINWMVINFIHNKHKNLTKHTYRTLAMFYNCPLDTKILVRSPPFVHPLLSPPSSWWPNTKIHMDPRGLISTSRDDGPPYKLTYWHL